jgi:hypothetical protein
MSIYGHWTFAVVGGFAGRTQRKAAVISILTDNVDLA